MALYLLVFGVCLLVIGSTVIILLSTRTPRYRTESHHLLDVFDKALASQVSESEWHTLIGYPIRHDEYLEGVRRRAVHLMEEHGRRWQIAQGKPLLDTRGQSELQALRDHLAARMALRQP
ncbi:hypothetical protein [Vreelandella subglaciescola]|jgi:hypothetical protein|uniref:Uncharacterized protein n=1 Tax=Vreelandella subglaciescola TaxID=29571 RepID=A0A1M7E6V3_9GAMM|nr:hypothetical protein [Halomonas subglaciescola]SHL87396.1 hypothetical protein SAMN05878437_0008 [Halomonas subglaciescola]SHM43944.1 hypothetical protein SAMN05878437_2959 [Halomonas subglaciescola]